MGNQATIQRNISEEVKRVKEATKKKFGNKPADYLVCDLSGETHSGCLFLK
jgi:hypothetical protein